MAAVELPDAPAAVELPDVEAGAAASQRLSLDGNEASIRAGRMHGFAVEVTAVTPVVISALEIQLKPASTLGRPRARRSSPVAENSAVRVFATRAERLSALWDWRQWVPVGSRTPEGGSARTPLTIPFDHPVPIAAGATRILYCFSPTGLSVSTDPSRRGRALGQDGAVCVRARASHAAMEIAFLLEGASGKGTSCSLQRATLQYSSAAAEPSASFDAKVHRFDDRAASLEEVRRKGRTSRG